MILSAFRMTSTVVLGCLCATFAPTETAAQDASYYGKFPPRPVERRTTAAGQTVSDVPTDAGLLMQFLDQGWIEASDCLDLRVRMPDQDGNEIDVLHLGARMAPRSKEYVDFACEIENRGGRILAAQFLGWSDNPNPTLYLKVRTVTGHVLVARCDKGGAIRGNPWVNTRKCDYLYNPANARKFWIGNDGYTEAMTVEGSVQKILLGTPDPEIYGTLGLKAGGDSDLTPTRAVVQGALLTLVQNAFPEHAKGLTGVNFIAPGLNEPIAFMAFDVSDADCWESSDLYECDFSVLTRRTLNISLVPGSPERQAFYSQAFGAFANSEARATAWLKHENGAWTMTLHATDFDKIVSGGWDETVASPAGPNHFDCYSYMTAVEDYAAALGC